MNCEGCQSLFCIGSYFAYGFDLNRQGDVCDIDDDNDLQTDLHQAECGSLREWRIDIVAAAPIVVSIAWINSGYNDGVRLNRGTPTSTFTNEGQGFIDDLVAGDVIRFTVQGNGTDFDNGSLSINFVSLTQTLPATGSCTNPIPVTLPFSFDGEGEHCWEVVGTVSFLNSWNTESV